MKLPLVPREQVHAELERMAAAHEAEAGWRPSDFDEIRGNDKVLYAHFPQIGCSGLLLDRVRGRIHILGSANSAEAYLWAYDRGFRLDDSNVLAITAIRDTEATVEVLKRAFRAPYVRAELAPKFEQLPLRIELDGQALWLMLTALFKTDAFDFEVNPP